MHSGGNRQARQRLVLPKILAAAVVGAATLAAGGQGTSRPSSQEPIKVGFLAPLSGPYVQNGRDILNGFLLALDEMGHRAGGRPIELIVEDDEAIPAVGLTKARKLIERDRVHLMTGALLSSTGYALAPYIDSVHIPMIYPVVSADDLTRRRASPWIVRTGWTGSQPNHAFGDACRTLKRRTIATIALDYAFGWESVGGFERTFQAEGGAIVKKIWCPVSVHDFAPYLAQIPKDVDAVYALVLGRAALQFMRQYREFGLKDRIMLIGGGTTTDEHVLPAMGDEAIGVITALHYSAALDTPADRKFVWPTGRDTRKSRATTPRHVCGAKWLAAAAAAVHGHVEDSQAFLQALRNDAACDGPAARARAAGRIRQPDRERLHQEGRTRERRAAEHSDRDRPRRLTVLEVQPR